MKNFFFAYLHELGYVKKNIKKVEKMKKVCPDPPSVEKILTFFLFLNEPFPSASKVHRVFINSPLEKCFFALSSEGGDVSDWHNG